MTVTPLPQGCSRIRRVVGRSHLLKKTPLLPKGVLRPLPFGHVAEDQDRPVPGDKDGVVGQGHDRALPQRTQGGVLDWPTRLLVDNVEHVRQRPAQAEALGRSLPGANRSGARPRYS